jgi:protein TonB
MKTRHLISALSACVALSGCVTQPTAPQPPPASANEVDTPPNAIRTVKPVYPQEAQTQGIVGVVTAVFDVDASGTVVFVTIPESPDPGLSKAVVDALTQWKFVPGTHNGKKVNVRMQMSFTFGRATGP